MNATTHGAGSLVPAEFQPPLPLDELVRREPPASDATPLDVLFVGGGPAGLAGAIALAQLARGAENARLRELEIGVLEKAAALGEHCLSGAVVNPDPLRELFPERDISELPLRGAVERDRVYLLGERLRTRIPTPPTMRNRGNHVASICEIVRWLGERAAELDVHLLTGFAAGSLLVEGERVVGIRTTASGLDREGRPGPAHLPATDLSARITVLAEGNRGALAQAWCAWQRVSSPNPQIHALGVKELWRVDRAPDAVIHTLGWPLPGDVFGGSFCYPMANDVVALGLVAGLDGGASDFDVHERLQALKGHPLFREMIRDGELLEWGAKTIPEGGFHSIPDRLSGDGLLLVGDGAGLVDVPSLKGIHYAMSSGMLAARSAFEAIHAEDTSRAGLERYDRALRAGRVGQDLHRTRNVRLAFKRGFVLGGARAAWMTLAGGRLSGPRIQVRRDAEEPRKIASEGSPSPHAERRLSKEDAVFHSGNETRDDLPSHLLASPAIPPEVASFYASMCPAAVYECVDGRLVVHPSNCIDCKTTDVLGPRWLPREGGTGPRYRQM